MEELARLGGFERLRDFGVPEDALDEVAEAVAARPGAQANPRPATAAEVEELLALDLVSSYSEIPGSGHASSDRQPVNRAKSPACE